MTYKYFFFSLDTIFFFLARKIWITTMKHVKRDQSSYNEEREEKKKEKKKIELASLILAFLYVSFLVP